MKAFVVWGACAWVFAAFPTGLVAQSSGSPLAIKSLFVPDELIVDFTEHLDQPVTKTLADVYAAAGVTEVYAMPTFVAGEQVVLVRLNPGTKFGSAFRTIQTFNFGPAPHWSIRYLQPNYLYFAASVGAPQSWHRVFNFSVRADVRAGDAVTIGGLVIPGEFPRLVVFKVTGRSLQSFGVNGFLSNPRLRLHVKSEVVLENDNWSQLADWEKQLARRICLPPGDPQESTIVTYLDPGIYTAVVSDADGGTGIALLEMYLVDEFMVQ